MRLECLLSASAASLVAAIAWTPAEASATSVWTWKLAGAQITGSGTFVTADVTPAPYTPYPIVDITGSITRQGVVTPVAAINMNFTSEFQWNGLADSPILVGPGGGGVFWFSTSPAESYVELYSGSATTATFEPANQLFFASDATGELVYPLGFSRLSPSQAPASVPAPLSLGGALLAYRAGRQLRQRRSVRRCVQ